MATHPEWVGQPDPRPKPGPGKRNDAYQLLTPTDGELTDRFTTKDPGHSTALLQNAAVGKCLRCHQRIEWTDRFAPAFEVVEDRLGVQNENLRASPASALASVACGGLTRNVGRPTIPALN